jgi:hypothetical protein
MYCFICNYGLPLNRKKEIDIDNEGAMQIVLTFQGNDIHAPVCGKHSKERAFFPSPVLEDTRMEGIERTALEFEKLTGTDYVEVSVKEKIAAQAEYQRRKNLPDCAPHDGMCWSCHKQIYNKITFQEASSKLITGCPYCSWSYCE